MDSGLEKLESEMKNKELKEKVVSFLKEDRPKYQSLGCGCHNGVYYFGTKLWREGKPYTAIITSDKKIYLNKAIKIKGESIGENEIKTKFGLNYKDDFYDEALDYLFSNKSIEEYLFGNTEHITLQTVFHELLGLLKKYLYFDSEVKYKLVACYRIAGFFMHVWKVRARLFLWAEMGSAKSRLTNILHNTGFNSVNLGDWTLPFLQRMIESTRGETHIDDFESLDEEKQKATKRLVKTGYMKGFKAGKTGDKTRKPEVYDLFNTTTINNTEGLDFISNDRTIAIRIPKISDSKYDKEPNFDDHIYKKIRNDLYILGLKEAERVAEMYPQIKSDKISGRLFSIIKPELTIAKLISDKLFTEIEDFWKEEIEQRDTKELADDWEFRAYQKIYELVVKQNQTDFFGLYDEVVLPLIREMYGEDEFDIKKYKFKMSSMMGNILSRNPIFKSRKVQGKTQYKVSKDSFIKLLKAKNLLTYITDYDSTSTTYSTTSTDPIPSTNEEEIVDSVETVESKT